MAVGAARAGAPLVLDGPAPWYLLVAAGLRILFAVIATKLLGIPGLLLVGSLLLFWVCWRLYIEIREQVDEKAAAAMSTAEDETAGYTGAPKRTLGQALISITIADFSMSLDNVLAVAAIADGHAQLLVFGLALSIILMAFAATMIMKLLTSRELAIWPFSRASCSRLAVGSSVFWESS